MIDTRRRRLARPRRGRRRGERFWGVFDPESLAALLIELRSELGGVSQLARRLNLSREEMYKLLDGKRSRITARTVGKLLRALPSVEHENLAAALLSPAARQKARRDDDRFARRQRALLGLIAAPAALLGSTIEVAPGKPVLAVAPDGMIYDARPVRRHPRRLPLAMEAAAHDARLEEDGLCDVMAIDRDPRAGLARYVLAGILRRRGYVSHFNSFRRALGGHPVDLHGAHPPKDGDPPGCGLEWSWRIQLAELEAVAPLSLPGRSFRKLHEAKQLGPFLKAALKQQELCLKQELGILQPPRRHAR